MVGVGVIVGVNVVVGNVVSVGVKVSVGRGVSVEDIVGAVVSVGVRVAGCWPAGAQAAVVSRISNISFNLTLILQEILGYWFPTFGWRNHLPLQRR